MSTIASSISLARYSGAIYDQGSQGACVANAYCGAVMLQAREYHQFLQKLSAQFTYNDTRILMGTFPADGGSGISYAQTSVTQHGMANEAEFPYGGADQYTVPSSAVYSDAAAQKVLSFASLNIYQSYGQLVATVGEQLMRGKATLVTAQNIKLADGTTINGGHEFFVVGKDDATQTLTFQNSWGSTWSDNGYGKIKYSDFSNLFVNGSFVGVQGLDVINGFNGVDVEWTAERTHVAQLYASLLERSGENFGITAWAQNVKNGMTMETIANAFYGSQEGQSLYVTMTNAQYINQIFHNILNRDADAAGLSLFQSQLASGVTRGSLALGVMQYIDQYNGSDAGTMASHDYLENRTTVSMNYGVTFQVDGSHTAVAVHSLVGVTDNADTVQVALVGIQQALGWV